MVSGLWVKRHSGMSSIRTATVRPPPAAQTLLYHDNPTTTTVPIHRRLHHPRTCTSHTPSKKRRNTADTGQKCAVGANGLSGCSWSSAQVGQTTHTHECMLCV